MSTEPVKKGRGLKSVGRDAGRTMIVEFWSIGLGLTLSVLLARSLGPEGNGLYALALLLPTTMAQLLNLGVASANIYYVGRGEVLLARALRATTRLGLILGLTGLLIAPLVVHFRGAEWFPGVPTTLMWVAFAAYPIGLFQGYYVTLLTAVKDFRRFNRTLAIMPFVTILLAAFFIFVLGLGVAGAVLAYLIGQLSGTIMSRVSLRTHLEVPEDARGPESWWTYGRRCIQYGWKAHLSNILAFVNYRADVFLVNIFLNPALVGIYFVAVQVAERLWLPSKILSTVLLPRMAETHAKEGMADLTPIMSRLVLWTTVAICLFIAVVAGPVVRVLFGDAYMGAIPPLLWLLPGIALASSARIVANDFAARGHPEWNSMLSAAILVVNIAANIVLIPRYGINGAAIATTISYAFNMVTKTIIYSRVSNSPWHVQIIPRREDFQLMKVALGLVWATVERRLGRGPRA
ncbi:MAG: flippase [Coriobacteriia bacterium]|nr:flippase [Coriobacteriia bacterium]